MKLSDGASRLFSHLKAEPDRHLPEVIERLLEDGDREDLALLTAEVTEAQLAAWLRERGARRLSERSRAFWSLVLDLPLEARPGVAGELWPL